MGLDEEDELRGIIVNAREMGHGRALPGVSGDRRGGLGADQNVCRAKWRRFWVRSAWGDRSFSARFSGDLALVYALCS